MKSVSTNLSNLLKAVIGASITAVVLIGCQYKKNNSVRDEVLVYCSEGSPETFNPQLSTSAVTFDASSKPLYNRLVEFKLGSNDIEPGLATNWQISPDGKEYTFQLRRNVQFHSSEHFTPTRHFNADDVIFSFHRQWYKDHPYHAVSSQKYQYFSSMGLGNLIEKIEKTDPYTIKFYLSRAETPFLATLAMDFASILSEEYAQTLLDTNNKEALDKNPIGTGPYQLVRYQPDAFIRYKAHPHYWQGEQKLKSLVFAITPDPSLRFARVVANECDVMANPLPVHVESSKQFENTQLLNQAGLNTAYLAMNTMKPPFDNQLVRIALNYAINKQAIIKAIYQGTAIPAVTPLPPNMWAHDASIKDFEYNPERALNLLKQAGFKDGFTMTIWTMSAQRSYNPNAKKMAELIQQDLQKIGVKVEIITLEYGAFLSAVRRGEHQSALLGWTGDNGDPDNFFSPLLSCTATLVGTNGAYWCDMRFSQLIQQARSKQEIAERKHLYDVAQRIFKHASPWVPIAHTEQYVILNPRVKNLKFIPNGGINFRDVFLEPKSNTEGS